MIITSNWLGLSKQLKRIGKKTKNFAVITILGHQLHTTVINDHVVVFDVGIILSDFRTRFEEKTVRDFPVGTVKIS